MIARLRLTRRSNERLFSRGKSGGKPAVIGIDLGTTNSCVAVMEGGRARVMSNADGQRTTPSYVSLPTDGSVVVGHRAKLQSDVDPTNTFYAVKRLMGRRYSDQEVQDQISTLPYRVVESSTGEAWLEGDDGKSRSPVDVSAIVLAEMKRIAERHLGEGEVGAAVVTVPAYFNDAQRQATKDAGERAGLEVLRVINEPTAAALAYGLGRPDYGRMRDDDNDDEEGGKLTAVYDLGGGTFDVSLLTIDEGVFQVKSTNGDTMLGGEDFDRVLVDHVISQLDEPGHVSRVRGSEKAMQRVKEEAERAKIELSTCESCQIELNNIVDGIHLSTTIARDEMEKLMGELAERTAAPCERALNDADAKRDDVGEVVMVGGMTRMPLVQRTAAAIFGRQPLGDAEVNPDEAVAMGAAIQGGVLVGQVADLLLLDVNPLSLGIETYGGAFARLIARNTTLPARASQVFSTAADGQTRVEINVFQGERAMAADNMALARFTLVDIPPAKHGTPRIEVGFDIDVSGIVRITAVDLQTGKQQRVEVDATQTRLSQSQVTEMVRSAERNKTSDKRKMARAELKNRIEVFVQDARHKIQLFRKQLPSRESTLLLEEIGTFSAEVEKQLVREGEEKKVVERLNALKQKTLALFADAAKNKPKK